MAPAPAPLIADTRDVVLAEEEVEKDGARIFIESKALMHVIGTRMDFVEDDLSSEFVFHNPNAEAACGCGESFTVADQGKTQANG